MIQTSKSSIYHLDISECSNQDNYNPLKFKPLGVHNNTLTLAKHSFDLTEPNVVLTTNGKEFFYHHNIKKTQDNLGTDTVKYTTQGKRAHAHKEINDRMNSTRRINYTVEIDKECIMIHTQPTHIIAFSKVNCETPNESQKLCSEPYMKSIDYDQTQKRYPVLYLQDGQNLFDDYAPYGNWSLDKKLAILAEQGMGDVIIIAIDHAKEKRVEEFTPSYKTKLGIGNGEKYAHRLSHDLVW